MLIGGVIDYCVSVLMLSGVDCVCILIIVTRGFIIKMQHIIVTSWCV